MVKKSNDFIKKNLVWFVLGAVLLGFLIGPNLSKHTLKSMKSLILPSVFTMLWASMINMKVEHFAKSFKQPKKLLVGNIMSLIVAPLLMYPIALIFASRTPKIFAGMVLTGLVPPGGFMPYWTMILNANMGLAVSLALTTFVFALVIIPYGMKFLAGSKVHVDVMFLFEKILILLVGPFVLAMITRWAIIHKKGEQELNKYKPYLSLLSSLLALYLVFTGVSLKAAFLLKHIQILVLPVIGAFLYYLIAYPFSYFVLHKLFKFPLFDAIPLIYGTSTKDLSVAMALAAAAFGPLTLLGVVMSMIFQMPMASMWYKYFSKLEIKEEEVVEREVVEIGGKELEVIDVYEEGELKEELVETDEEIIEEELEK